MYSRATNAFITGWLNKYLDENKVEVKTNENNGYVSWTIEIKLPKTEKWNETICDFLWGSQDEDQEYQQLKEIIADTPTFIWIAVEKYGYEDDDIYDQFQVSTYLDWEPHPKLNEWIECRELTEYMDSALNHKIIDLVRRAI